MDRFLALRLGERPAPGTVRAGHRVLGTVGSAERRAPAPVPAAVLTARDDAQVPPTGGALGLGTVLRTWMAVKPGADHSPPQQGRTAAYRLISHP